MVKPAHVEISSLHPGMPVTQGQREFGRLEEVIPQPDRIHVVRLITRRSSDGKLVSIPIDWACNVVDGQVLLTLDRDELDHLPEYVPPIPSAEARDRVQRALQEHPATAAAGIQVHDRDGSIELHGRVRDVETRTVASEVARGVRGTVPIRNRLRTEESTESQVSAIGYGYAWLHTLMERATGLDLEESQIARIEEFAEQKLVDLFDVAEDVAAANGRSRLLRQELPVTKGLQLILMEVTDLAHEFKLEPLLLFLSDAGVRAPIDEGVHSDVPRLLAGLLVLCGRIIDVVEPAAQRSEAGRPSGTAVARAQAVVDLVL